MTIGVENVLNVKGILLPKMKMVINHYGVPCHSKPVKALLVFEHNLRYFGWNRDACDCPIEIGKILQK